KIPLPSCHRHDIILIALSAEPPLERVTNLRVVSCALRVVQSAFGHPQSNNSLFWREEANKDGDDPIRMVTGLQRPITSGRALAIHTNPSIPFFCMNG
ncbi:hypothetical protein BC936DRAFT_137310, partial [Jimgerdemannia flammicorona]